MALSHSPQIVLDGLVLYIDQFNPKSYPGSGVTLYDLSGNNRDYTLFNGGTFVQNPIFNYTGNFNDSRGYAPGYRQSSGIWMDGIDDYLGSTFYSAISGLTQITVEVCYGMRQYNTNRTLVSTLGNSTNLDGFQIETGDVASIDPIQINFRKGSTVRSFDFNPNPSGRREPMYVENTELSMYGFNSVTARMWGAGGTVFADISVNGSTLTNTRSAALSGITSINPLWFAKNPVGTTSSAQMFGSAGSAATFAYLRIYNRLLSEAEIQQNYAAMKGRYKTS
jgi:hypothetical protein